MLEEALQTYEGAALIISHDRYFIRQTANRIVELRDGELVLYQGDYAYYCQKKAEEREAAAAAVRARAAQEKAGAKRAGQCPSGGPQGQGSGSLRPRCRFRGITIRVV